ncbi:helix-turn-helix domain-containing protein [Haladaptatus sp. DJG-WS-42]|uniref:helix-turn-helix domain-containing protein n=1 Tax=Haladaptatus sp. DJG-WS-42 TaxID=3120516 RepID=UPI0030CE4A5B
MSTILEFVLPSESFMFGSALTQSTGIHIELERIVPLGEQPVPYIWVSGAAAASFERLVTASPEIESLTLLDQIDDRLLYRVVCTQPSERLLTALLETGGTVLEAHGDDSWFFRVRFQNHDSVTAFHTACDTYDIPVEVERIATLDAIEGTDMPVTLTEEQQEALILAVKKGYFESPRLVSLDELSDELGITPQAVSKRLRPAIKKTIYHSVRSLNGSDVRERR